MIFEIDGKVANTSFVRTKGGYFSLFENYHITTSELRRASAGTTREPAAVWSLRDDIQQSLVRRARTFGVQLPAMYLTQRGLTDPVFGTNEDRKKVTWYNPIDVIADFAKQSAKNVASILSPLDIGGVAASRMKFLANAPYTLNPNLQLTSQQMRWGNRFADIKVILGEFGQDVQKVLTGINKRTTSIGAAFSSAVEETRANQGGIVFAMHQARNAGSASRDLVGPGRLRRAGAYAKGLIFGHQSRSATSPDDNIQLQGLIDVFPSLRGTTTGSREFARRYKAGKKAYDVITGALSYDEALASISTMRNVANPRDLLESSVMQIRNLHGSKFSDLSRTLLRYRGSAEDLTRGDFYREIESNEYQKALRNNLVSAGVSPGTANKFVEKIGLDGTPTSYASRTNVSQRIMLGGTKIIDDNSADDFLDQVIARAKKLERFDDPTFTRDALGSSIRQTDLLFTQRGFRRELNAKAERTWKATYENIIVNQGRGLVKAQKALYEDFVGDISSEKSDYLSRTAADVLGIRLLDDHGARVSRTVIANQLGRRGIDVENTGQVMAFLMENRRMTTPSSVGGFNMLGLKPLLIDEAFSSGFFNDLEEEQREIVSNLAADIARTDPVSPTVGYSVLRGVSRTRSGDILDTTRLASSAKRVLNFIQSQMQIPLVKFNPVDMSGYGGPQGVDERQMFQIVRGFSNKPFGGLDETRPGLFVFTQQKRGYFGPTGSLFTVTGDDYDMPVIRQRPGKFKMFSTSENDMFSKAARRAAERRIKRAAEGTIGLATPEAPVEDESTLQRIIRRIKDVGDIAEEQPNSLSRFVKRFRERKQDIFNPVVMATMIRDRGRDTSSIPLRFNITRGTDDTVAPRVNIVNDAGDEIYSHTQVLQAFEAFRRKFQSYGTPLPVIKEFEAEGRNRDLFRAIISGEGVSREALLGDVRSEADMRSYAVAELQKTVGAIEDARGRGLDTRSLTAASGIVRKKLEIVDMHEVSPRSVKSPTISTRMDELRESIFQLILQRKSFQDAIGSSSINVGELAIEFESVVADLLRENRISGNQAAEARAAGMSAITNMIAFAGYRRSGTEGENLSRALASLLDLSDSRINEGAGSAMASLLDPFISQKIANVGSGGFGNDFLSLIRPAISRNLKPSEYRLSDLNVNPLGNQGFVFVPTFGTVVQNLKDQEDSRLPLLRALGSATGITTYDDTAAFSAASVAASHYVERLNPYFETLGLGLDASEYSGPVSMFAKGMVMKRVLPIFAGGTAAMTVDRTIGGLINEKDDRGERVYSPFFGSKIARGAVEAQSLLSGVVPGGMGYREKREQLLEGEVPVQQGRYWPLGITPFEGGKVMYYRPSYYRKMQAATTYTSDAFGSPIEKFLFGYDFSPLRPFDPYRFEKEHYYDRPYPVTGEYFTGPFGPVTSILNATIGKVLKPKRTMHEEELVKSLGQYVSAGQSGAYNPEGLIDSGKAFMQTPIPGIEGSVGPAVPIFSGDSRLASVGAPIAIGRGSASGMYSGQGISQYNQALSQAGSLPLGTASAESFRAISAFNTRYVQASQYGPPPTPGVVPPRIVPAGEPVGPNSFAMAVGDIGYKLQEMGGIYGFAFGSLREKFGYGKSDFEPQRSLLQSASKAYGSGRAFWDLNLGGLGDLPIKAEGAAGNIELSEITRRFIPKERTDVTYLNPISNLMGQQYPFLPGSSYFINFKQGDPFVKVQEGESRLPGVGYERLNQSMPEYSSPLTQLDILSDIAPYSKEFRSLNNQITMSSVDPGQREKLADIRSKVEEITRKKEFYPYQYKYSTKEEMGINGIQMGLGRMGEYIAHRDTYINTKLLNRKTAQEDWESRNVYGSTFPEWQSPIESFIKPMMYKSSNRNPFSSGLLLAGLGAAFGKTVNAASLGSVVGFTTGAGYSAYSHLKQKITGDRFIPQQRKKELALEEYIDIINYVKNTKLSNEARQSGDEAAAAQFSQAARRTMYGADIYGSSVDTLSLAIPRRKREHFKAMINAPEEERARILSTAPRLERRIYQAAWGMPVEEKPDLVEYFSRHELPDLGWEGWHPNTNMEHVKIKMGESLGINMSQMGYYPQQVTEAQMTNPSYPSFKQESNPAAIAAQIRMMMSRNGINGNVVQVLNGFGSSGIDIFSGVR